MKLKIRFIAFALTAVSCGFFSLWRYETSSKNVNPGSIPSQTSEKVTSLPADITVMSCTSIDRVEPRYNLTLNDVTITIRTTKSFHDDRIRLLLQTWMKKAREQVRIMCFASMALVRIESGFNYSSRIFR